MPKACTGAKAQINLSRSEVASVMRLRAILDERVGRPHAMIDVVRLALARLAEDHEVVVEFSHPVLPRRIGQ